MFELFQLLDKSILDLEKRRTYVRRIPNVWPSEASASLINTEESEGCGKCRRAVYYRMTGRQPSNPPDALAYQIMRLGRAMEVEVVAQIRASDVFVASGVRYSIPDILMSLELDAVILNPETRQSVLCEIKSFDGRFAEQQIIGDGKPKLDHIVQLVIYLNELRTGARLKEAIAKGLEDREEREQRESGGWNRIEVCQENLNLIDDGDLAGKLLYVNRTGRSRREFDIGIYADQDGFHYPTVEGAPWKLLTIESIYDRFQECQANWDRAVVEANKRLALRGILDPTHVSSFLPIDPNEEPGEEFKKEMETYWATIGTEIENLPDSFLPKADFEYRYSKDKIEALYVAGKVFKTKYTQWKKRHAIIGAWQCLLPESLVELDDGSFVPIQDTKVGQETALGRISAKVAQNTKKEIVCVKPYDLLPLYLTADHEWKVADGSFIASGDLLKLTAAEYVPVSKGGGLVDGEYKREKPPFHEVVVPFDTTEVRVSLSDEELFIIGLWLAEGHFAHRDPTGTKWYKVGFTLNQNEGYLVEQIANWARGFTNQFGKPATITDRIVIDKRNGNHSRLVVVNSQDAAAFIERNAGCGGAKHKSILPGLMRAGITQQIHLLEGLIVGDGCDVAMRGTEMHDFTSVSAKLALQVQRLLWRQGKVAGIVPQKSSSGFRNGKEGISYHTRWYNRDSVVSRIEGGKFYTAIHHISRNVDYKGLVYDLTIEGTHEIPTASGVVHNCRYCDFKNICVAKEYPDLRYIVQDLKAAGTDDEG